MRGSDLIRSGHSATGAIGTALAGEVTASRLRVPGSPLGFCGARRERSALRPTRHFIVGGQSAHHLALQDPRRHTPAWMDPQMIDPIPAKPPLARLPLWVPPVLLAILASLTFSAGLTGSFVLDDDSAAAQHPVVQGKTPLIDAFTLNFWGRPLSAFPPAFRPLTTLSFVVEPPFGGQLGPGLSRLVPALVHRSCADSLDFRAAVYWPSGSVDSGGLLHSHACARRERIEHCGASRHPGRAVGFARHAILHANDHLGKETPPSRLLLAALAFVAAMLSKENMVVLPIIIALFVEYRRRSQGSLSPFKAHVPSLIMVAVLAIYAVVRLRLQPAATPPYRAPDDVLVGASLWEKVGYGLELLARYSGLVAAPTGLCTGRKFAEVFRPQHVSFVMTVGAAAP